MRYDSRTMTFRRKRCGWRWLFLVAAMALPAQADVMIDAYGHYPQPGILTFFHLREPRNWTVDVSPQSLMYTTTTASGLAVKVTPPGWNARPGWFVFVGDTEAWAYDGAGDVIAEILTPTAIHGYKFESRRNWARTWGAIPNPPKDVFDRLPSNIQAIVRKTFPEGR